jgi:hypothetical protein
MEGDAKKERAKTRKNRLFDEEMPYYSYNALKFKQLHCSELCQPTVV